MGQENETGKSPISYASIHYDVIFFFPGWLLHYTKRKDMKTLPTFVIVVTSVPQLWPAISQNHWFIFLGTLKTFFLSLNVNDLYIILKLISSILSCTIALQSTF